jgi:predicted nucleic acid-binding Zn ribbon protein
MTVRINVAIESSLRRFGIVRKVKRSQAVFMWEDVVGPAAAKVSSAVTCRDGILFVEVKNSVWAAPLSNLPPAWSTVKTTSTAGLPALGWIS